jgi:hypothetical protein
MLCFAEEIMLLLLDDRDGSFLPVPRSSLRSALAGAVLMDLALLDRIDTDPRSLFLVDEKPTGDPLLDPTLERIAASRHGHDVPHWVWRAADDADEIREAALARLVEKGILTREEDRFLWVFRSRRYPSVDGKAEREVKLRIMGVLLSDEIPDPRDIAIIGLCDACGILDHMMAPRELGQARARIDQVSRLDLIGQSVANVIEQTRELSRLRSDL